MLQPVSQEPVSVRETFRQVVDLIEHYWDSTHEAENAWIGLGADPERVKSDVRLLLALNDSEQLLKQIWAPYESAVVFRIPTVCCCRKYAPITWFFMMVCMAAKLHPQDVFDAFISERGFWRLKKTAGKMCRARFRMLDATEPENFWLFLEDVARHGASGIICCDWEFDLDEHQVAEAITKNTNLLFVCPEK